MKFPEGDRPARPADCRCKRRTVRTCRRRAGGDQDLVHTQPDNPQAAEVASPKTDATAAEPPASEVVLANPTLERAMAAAESMNLGLHLGAAVMRIADAANKGSEGATELREAVWLIERYIELLDVRPLGADINAEQRRLARIEETLERLRAMSAAVSAQPAEPALPPESRHCLRSRRCLRSQSSPRRRRRAGQRRARVRVARRVGASRGVAAARGGQAGSSAEGIPGGG